MVKEQQEPKNQPFLNLEDYFSGKKKFQDLIELSFEITDPNKQDILLNQWVNLIEKYPKQAYVFIELFGQDAFGTPKGFLNAVFSVFAKPETSSLVINSILPVINTQFWYRKEEMMKAFSEYLNFSDYENIGKAGAILEYITFFINQSDMDDSFYNETVGSFEKILREKINERRGSYLLNIRAEQLLEKRKYEPSKEYAPFQITKGKYAMIQNRQLCLAKEEDLEKISSILKEVQGARYSGDGERVRGAMKHVNDLNNYFVEPVKNCLFIKNKPELNDINDFAYLQRASIRNFIEKEFRFKISELSIPEQFQVLKFIKYQDIESVGKVKSFSHTFGVIGFRTFLSVEHGGKEMGDKILALGEKLTEDLAKKVFSKYSEIVDAVSNIEQTLFSWYQNTRVDQVVFEKLKEKLFKEGVLLLNDIYLNIDKKDTIKEEDILSRLEEVKTNILILGSSYLELYKQNREEAPKLEDILNMSIQKTKATLLSQETKLEIIDVYKKGRPKNTYENEAHLNLLIDEFTDTLQREDTFVFNIIFQNEIISFASFYKEGEDTLHIGGLTFLEGVKNGAIAEAVLFAIIKEFKNFNIKGLVDKKNPMLNMYTKRFGFKVVKDLPKEENAGEDYVEILREKGS